MIGVNLSDGAMLATQSSRSEAAAPRSRVLQTSRTPTQLSLFANALRVVPVAGRSGNRAATPILRTSTS